MTDLQHSKVAKAYQYEDVRPVEPLEKLRQCFLDNLAFNSAVTCLADAAKRCESWEQVKASMAANEPEGAQVAMTMLERIKDKLTVVEFCELANDKDDQQRWVESGGKEPLNAGLDKIKDIYCGKTRAERMIVIDPTAL
jgi:hypothetical protein